MPHDTLHKLIDSLEASGYETFREYDAQFFMLFYDKFKNIPFRDVPDTAFIFMEVNNWQGMSLRCGVWQYYESGSFQKGKFERVLSLLRSKNEKDMAAIYAYGIHDYANAEYQGNFNYPKEWIDEADRIDKWISDHEAFLYRWRCDLILNYKNEILKLEENRFI